MQNAAFILIGLGILALIGWGVQGFFMASEISLLIKIAVGAVGVGVLILIGVAIKDRLKKARKDEFKENFMTFQSYNAVSLLAQAISKCQSSDPFIIASRIKNTSDMGWDNLGGNLLLFDSHGDITNPIFLLKKYNDGQFQLYKKEEE